MQTIGIAVLALGIFLLLVSAVGAYTFPTSSAPANADLPTLLTFAWQKLVILITMLMAGIVGILAGTILYGFGRA